MKQTTTDDSVSTDTKNVFIETPTEYDEAVACDHPISIHVSGATEQEMTLVAQRLSLFVEEHDPRVLLDTFEAISAAADNHDQIGAEVTSEPSIDGTCHWPVELEVEEIGFDKAHQIVGALNQLFAEGFDTPMIPEVRHALKAATADQPRSVVRLCKHDGSKRDGLEWHTDTDADLQG